MGAEGTLIQNGRCILLTGGPIEDCDQAAPDLRPDDFLIACDAGLLLAERFGWKPDLAVGDFDSLGRLPESGLPTLRAPAEKDDTDTMMALREGLARGYRDFLLIGALGGRLDHSIANLQALSFLCAEGAKGEIRANRSRVWAVQNGGCRLAALPGWYLSVFAWGGVAKGVTLRGVAYPLEDAELTPDFPIGVSNAFTAETAEISVREGTLLLIAATEHEGG